MNSSAILPISPLINPFLTSTASLPINTTILQNPIIAPSTGGLSTCISGTIPIPLNTTGLNIPYSPPPSQPALTQSLVNLLASGPSWLNNILSNSTPTLISGTHDIFIKLCLPSNLSSTSRIKTIQLLTHGATLDHNYWDISPSHSYIDAATSSGHATLSYDTLGVGKSSHPDPIQTVQASSQLAVTHHLASLLRHSHIAGFTFENVVGVGHSAGSTLTQAITTQYPSDFDAVILTGTTASAASVGLALAAFNLINANTDPAAPQFKGLPAGYLTQQSAAGIQFAFYRYPNYDEDAFARQVANKQTNTLGVLLTLGGLVAPSTRFTGPVMIVNGEHDFVFCGGNCLYPTDQNVVALEAFYPAAAKGSRTYIAEGAGHSIAAHRSGPDSFREMIQFLQANDL
ncbi:Alpha/Beta hydrolase protein [Trichoderma aethiopicum]